MIPHYYFDRIWDIPPEFLKEKGITGVILDIDGTLAPDGDPEAHPKAKEWVARLPEYGIKASIVSNNGDGRVAPFAGTMGLSYVSHALKPSLKTLDRTLAVVGSEPSHIAVIGDQLFTDILYAKRGGFTAIMVQHAWPDIYPFVKFKRVLEAPFMPYIKRRKRP